MGIIGLNEEETKFFKTIFDGNFEDMLRKCHEFDEVITMKNTNGIFTSVDKAGNNVLIGYWPGDVDCFDDTVFVIYGEKTDYLKRDDYGKYRTHDGYAPSLYQERYNELFQSKVR